MDKENIEKKKRKRTANTTSEQYEEYLKLIESDYIVRSGSINPNVDDDYIKNKWENLVQKLNAIGSGPKLSMDEWKKRMNDWKNSTRAKYRKMHESRMKTGGGEGIKIKLTSLEERGLAAWGKVAVSGCKEVPETGGLCEVTELEDHNNTAQESSQFVDNAIVQNIIIEDIVIEDNSNANNNISCNVQTPKVPKIQRRNRKRVNKPLNETAQTLLQNYEESLNINKTMNAHLDKFVEVYSRIEEKKLDLEREKFKFEVAKYKFENVGFNFEEICETI